MKAANLFFSCLIAVLALSCGTALRKGVPAVSRPTPEALGYTGDLLPAFYYTEGVKRGALNGDPAGAVGWFEKALAVDSLHAPSYFEAADALSESDPERALRYSQRAVALDSTNTWFQGQLGRLLLLTGDYDQALTMYRRLTREDPNNPDNYRLLAALYEHLKQPFTAISILDSAEYRFGRIEELAEMKRQLLINVKLFDKAIEESQAMVQDFPFREENYVILAQLYAAAGKDSLALANFDAALALHPASGLVLGAMNDYYKDKGDHLNYLATAKQIFLSDDMPVETKIRFFEELTRDRDFYRSYYMQLNDLASTLLIKYPDNEEVLRLYAGHMIASGNAEEALKLYKSRVQSPGGMTLDMFNAILDIETYMKRTDSVSKYAAMALEYFPENTGLYVRYGAILAHLGEPKKARKVYEKGLKYADSDSVRSIMYGSLGDLLHKENNPKRSFAYYDKALRYDPDNAMVLNNYSYFLSTSDRQLEKSLEMGRRATELRPAFPTYLDTYAWALYKLGRFDDAKKIMQQALSLDRANNTELMIHYGDILYALKDYFMASFYWKKALEHGHAAAEIEERLKRLETDTP